MAELERENPNLELPAFLCPDFDGHSRHPRRTTLQHLGPTVRRGRIRVNLSASAPTAVMAVEHGMLLRNAAGGEAVQPRPITMPGAGMSDAFLWRK